MFWLKGEHSNWHNYVHERAPKYNYNKSRGCSSALLFVGPVLWIANNLDKFCIGSVVKHFHFMAPPGAFAKSEFLHIAIWQKNGGQLLQITIWQNRWRAAASNNPIITLSDLYQPQWIHPVNGFGQGWELNLTMFSSICLTFYFDLPFTISWCALCKFSCLSSSISSSAGLAGGSLYF